jgi:hypothetical protein
LQLQAVEVIKLFVWLLVALDNPSISKRLRLLQAAFPVAH